MTAIMTTILLVDDDPVFLFIHERVLTATNSQLCIRTAANGKQALQDIYRSIEGKSVLPDIIFLDMNMPVMSGVDFLIDYRTLLFPGKEHIKIVMLTTEYNCFSSAELEQYRIHRFLQKPLTAVHLKDLFDLSENHPSFSNETS